MTLITKILHAKDHVSSCGPKAKEEVRRLCKKRNVQEAFGLVETYTEEYFTICNEVLVRWHTTKKFKVGDKVYIKPQRYSPFRDCVRATIIDIGPKWGYELRAFEQDCPGVWVFNQWDKDLLPRTSKAKKVLVSDD